MAVRHVLTEDCNCVGDAEIQWQTHLVLVRNVSPAPHGVVPSLSVSPASAPSRLISLSPPSIWQILHNNTDRSRPHPLVQTPYVAYIQPLRNPPQTYSLILANCSRPCRQRNLPTGSARVCARDEQMGCLGLGHHACIQFAAAPHDRYPRPAVARAALAYVSYVALDEKVLPGRNHLLLPRRS